MIRVLPMITLLAAIHGPTPALAQQFEPRPGLQALASGATGVLEIGAVDIGQVEVVLRALVHNGQVLQVHSLRGGEWLAKRSGSLGGKTLAPTTLDALAHVAGGIDIDVRCQPPAVRAEFARAADVLPPAGSIDCSRAATPQPPGRIGHAAGAADPPPVDCGAIGCRVLYRHATASAAFQIRFDPQRSIWGFEGYGIVAIWTIPDG